MIEWADEPDFGQLNVFREAKRRADYKPEISRVLIISLPVFRQ